MMTLLCANRYCVSPVTSGFPRERHKHRNCLLRLDNTRSVHWHCVVYAYAYVYFTQDVSSIPLDWTNVMASYEGLLYCVCSWAAKGRPLYLKNLESIRGNKAALHIRVRCMSWHIHKQILHLYLLEFPFCSLANFGATNSKTVERVVQEVV